ncbi:MAG: hypothetical protein IPL31_08000 [Saprospiraceae bacterium]|nr:hypothetical protein [Saprospiraceae bacterium]
MDTIFLLIEYSGVPIGLILYNLIIKKLANADPIPTEDNNIKIWNFGLELMVITSVSTVLYAISFASHTNGEGLSYISSICIIICLSISIFEYFILILVTHKVRQWGSTHPKTLIYPNCFALLFWVVLILLIIGCSNYKHYIANKYSATTNNTATSWINQGNNSILIFIGLSFLASILIFFIVKKIILNIKRKAIIDYNKGSKLLKHDPLNSINKLKDSLKKIPENSPLIIDIYMKLSRIYLSFSDLINALNQIELLEQTTAYKSLHSFLRDGIIKSKFDILLKMNKISEAENLIHSIHSPEISEILKLAIYENSKKQHNAN